MVVPLHGDLPESAREFYESLQLHPTRRPLSETEISQPMYLASVQIYTVSEPLDVPSPSSSANPQFGSGGGTQMLLPDVND